jgi:hypothetical protein
VDDREHDNGCNACEHDGPGHRTIIWFRWSAPLLLRGR